MTTLMVYASERGSTRQTAERIAERLSTQHGISVECRSVDNVSDLTGYKKIIIGSAVINFEWVPRGQNFVRKHKAYLNTVPVWAFSMGFVSASPRIMFGKDFEQKEDKMLEDALRKSIDIKQHAFFNGKFQRNDAGRLFGVMWFLAGGRFGDRRDWQAVDRWADEIADEVKAP
jgi:menaquinone-dependent protoporphyrinogen oxidase